MFSVSRHCTELPPPTVPLTRRFRRDITRVLGHNNAFGPRHPDKIQGTRMDFSANPHRAHRVPMYGTNGAVATSQPLAAQAGLDVLRGGVTPLMRRSRRLRR